MTVITCERSSGVESSELVWDPHQTAAGTAGHVALGPGETSDWTPARLLATAVGASLMTTFVDVATVAGLPLLGYTSQEEATLGEDGHEIVALSVAPCISVPSTAAGARARELWSRAMERAPVVKLLRGRLECEPRFVVVGDVAPIDEQC